MTVQASRMAGVHGDDGGAIDAQSFVDTGDKEEQADLRILGDVSERIQAVVAGPIGDGKGGVVEDMGETGMIGRGG